MAEGNEKMYGLKIRVRQLADRAIAFNKGVTLAFRENCGCKERAVAERNRGSHRNALPVQISEKLGLRSDIGITARASLRDAKNETLSILGANRYGIPPSRPEMKQSAAQAPS